MIIVLGLGLIAVALFAIGHFFGSGDCSLVGGCFVFVLLVTLILLPICQAGIKAEIQEFLQTAQTLDAARVNENISPYEIAAIQNAVIECNQWLVRSQYWARYPLTNWFYPKAILALKPIR